MTPKLEACDVGLLLLSVDISTIRIAIVHLLDECTPGILIDKKTVQG